MRIVIFTLEDRFSAWPDDRSQFRKSDSNTVPGSIIAEYVGSLTEIELPTYTYPVTVDYHNYTYANFLITLGETGLSRKLLGAQRGSSDMAFDVELFMKKASSVGVDFNNESSRVELQNFVPSIISQDDYNELTGETGNGGVTNGN